MNDQRRVIFSQRMKILKSKNIEDTKEKNENNQKIIGPLPGPERQGH